MMVMAVAFLTVMVVVIVAMALVIVVMMVLMVMAVTLLAVMVVMMVLMVVIVAVAFHMLVQLVVESGVVDRVEHPVPELVLVHVDDGAHEREADLLHGLEGAVVLHAVLEIGEVQGQSLPVPVHDGRLDVAEEASGLLGDPLSDGQEGLRHPGLGVRVPSGDGTLQALRASVGDLEGRLLMVMIMVVVVIVAVAFLAVMVVMVVSVAHLIIS